MSSRVLFLVYRIPYPPDKGDKIRSYNELRALAEVAEVSVACFIDDDADEAHVPALREMCAGLETVRLSPLAAKARSLGALATGGPLSLAYYKNREMARRVRSLGDRGGFDATLVFSSSVAPYADLAPARRRVLDLCDLDSEKWGQYAEKASFPMSFVYKTEARRLGAYERAAAGAFDATLLVSKAEAETLRAGCPGADVRVIPNGVDLDALDPGGADVAGEEDTLVFCGAMDYFSNVDAVVHFCTAILPRVRAERPGVKFRIIGSKPAPEVQRLAEQPGVTVTGRVPDVRPEILRGAVSVAPLRIGRGVPNKILEALALGLPVVTTGNGAAGLDLDDFPGVDVARDDEAFAAAVARRLAAGVVRYPDQRALLEDRYSWRRHDELLRRVVLSPD